jgi:hypothetical protein
LPTDPIQLKYLTWPAITFPEYGGKTQFLLGFNNTFLFEETGDRGYVNLGNPTFEQLVAFLASDLSRNSVAGQDPAGRLQQNANKSGFRCAAIYLGWQDAKGKNQFRILNAFETLDKGMIWVEPGRSASIYKPCNNRDDVFPVNPKGNPVGPDFDLTWEDALIPPAHSLNYVIYIW